MKQIFFLLIFICVPWVANATCPDAFKGNDVANRKETAKEHPEVDVNLQNKKLTRKEAWNLYLSEHDVKIQNSKEKAKLTPQEVWDLLTEHPEVDVNIQNLRESWIPRKKSDAFKR